MKFRVKQIIIFQLDDKFEQTFFIISTNWTRYKLYRNTIRGALARFSLVDQLYSLNNKKLREQENFYMLTYETILVQVSQARIYTYIKTVWLDKTEVGRVEFRARLSLPPGRFFEKGSIQIYREIAQRVIWRDAYTSSRTYSSYRRAPVCLLKERKTKRPSCRPGNSKFRPASSSVDSVSKLRTSPSSPLSPLHTRIRVYTYRRGRWKNGVEEGTRWRFQR